MKLLSLFTLALSSSFTPVLCNLLDHSTRHNHQDSELVQFYKRAYQSDSGPGAISFRDAIAPDGVFYTNGMLLEYEAYDATNTVFFTLYKSTEFTFSDILEQPKINGTSGEGFVAAIVHFKGETKKGHHDSYTSHALLTIEKRDGKQKVTQIFETVDISNLSVYNSS